MRHAIWLGFLTLCLLLAGSAQAEGIGVTYRASESADSVIRTQEVEGTETLFLPSSASAGALTLLLDAQGDIVAQGDNGRTLNVASGVAFDLASLFETEPEDGQYHLTLKDEGGNSKTIVLMFSANIRSMYLVSRDPENYGQAWLDDCNKHEKSTDGRMVLLRANGGTVYDGKLSNIRGRGNTTWGNYPLDYDTVTTVNKKPYQIQLKTKTDLLETGEDCEAAKTWLLMAEYLDGSMLHNRVSLDLARELGEDNASHMEPVDLYYDGKYLGLYSLAEKVEVSEGRVDIQDYEKILKKLNQKANISLDSLVQVQAKNKYGAKLVATEGVEDADSTDLGGYLLELDESYYTEQQAYFTLSDGKIFTVRNPEHASVDMVTYLSNLMEDATAALTNYGINPETGKTWKEYFDTDSLLPFFWVNELSKNPDLWYSSTYLWLPAGSGQIHLGPVWDFDLAYYLRSRPGYTDATGYTDSDREWGYYFCCIPEFQEMASRYFNDVFLPLLENILLGDESAHGVYLHSLTWYWQEVSAARRMNDVLWDPASIFDTIVAPTYEENYENFRTFLQERIAWLKTEVEGWPLYAEANEVDITLTAPYADMEEGLTLTMDDLRTNVAMATMEWGVQKDATETEDAIWRVDITINAKPGVAIPDELKVVVNGTVIPAAHNDSGGVTLSVWLADPSYRLAEYEDEDYGLVFNADYYAAHYPDIVAEVGDDPAALLEYYVDYGIAEGQVANAFFDPKEVVEQISDVKEMWSDSYEDIVYFFTEAGYTDWMERLGKTFTPEVWASEP